VLGQVFLIALLVMASVFVFAQLSKCALRYLCRQSHSPPVMQSSWESSCGGLRGSRSCGSVADFFSVSARMAASSPLAAKLGLRP